MPYGKYKHKTLNYVFKINKNYLEWFSKLKTGMALNVKHFLLNKSIDNKKE